ncbi:hypothetical protein F5I97DRAFT_366362 [Phlebopus sp. FC_14]|nr:hypothetical protein F5I97DRAFT_366362 [Phlebopus sp. FC_14]
MGKFYDEIPESLLDWIKKQQMFWVATAPLSPHGHINLSPKGTADCFHVVNSKRVYYEDLTGSGVETISHVRENGRITIMFSAFEGPPRILRLFGVGTVHEYGTPEYESLIPPQTRKPGSRAAIVVDVYQVGTSCGYAVPLRLSSQTKAMCNDEDAKVSPRPKTLGAYWALKNSNSLDGLPALLTAPSAIAIHPPQNNFDRNAPRPKLRSTKQSGGTEDHGILGNTKTLAVGFALGAVTSVVFTRLLSQMQA